MLRLFLHMCLQLFPNLKRNEAKNETAWAGLTDLGLKALWATNINFASNATNLQVSMSSAHVYIFSHILFDLLFSVIFFF